MGAGMKGGTGAALLPRASPPHASCATAKPLTLTAACPACLAGIPVIRHCVNVLAWAFACVLQCRAPKSSVRELAFNQSYWLFLTVHASLDAGITH